MLEVQSEIITMTAHTSQQDQQVYRITLRGLIDEEASGTALPGAGLAPDSSHA